MITETIQSGNALKRVELIFSSAIEEDIFSGFEELEIGKKFTKISSVQGVGCSKPKFGDAIWPQLNTYLLIFCDEEEAAKVVQVVEKVRKLYPVEGIACFESDSIVR